MKFTPKTWFLIAILLRLIIMPLFYHPDMKSQYFHFQFLSQGQLNIYDYIAHNSQSLPYRDTFNYLPLTYLFFGTVNILLKPFQAAGFTGWINNWGENQNLYPNLPYYLLVLKIPYLIFDILTALIIFKLTPKNKSYYLTWLFNPVSLYLIYVLGNFDIVPMFLSLLSYYFLSRHKSALSLFILGLAVSLKLYPIMFLPFFIKKIKPVDLIFFFTPIILSILPFLSSPYFIQSFLGSGLTQKILEFKIQSIPVFPILYFLIFIKSYFFKKTTIPESIFFTFLIFIPLVKFHPQWIIWFLPFILLSLTSKIVFPLALTFLLSFLYILLFNDQYLVWGHFIPVDNQFLNVRLPYDLIRFRLLVDPLVYQNYLRLALGLVSLFTFLVYEKNHHSNSN